MLKRTCHASGRHCEKGQSSLSHEWSDLFLFLRLRLLAGVFLLVCSEDYVALQRVIYLSGLTALACPKHSACNNKNHHFGNHVVLELNNLEREYYMHRLLVNMAQPRASSDSVTGLAKDC